MADNPAVEGAEPAGAAWIVAQQGIEEILGGARAVLFDSAALGHRRAWADRLTVDSAEPVDPAS
ncbi:hypothetical protein [Nocardia sp. MW-W600-9]